jgi:hypothetical protein
MVTEPVRTCDLCHNEMSKGKAYPQVKVPIPESVREELQREFEAQGPGSGILRLLPVVPVVSHHYAVDICTDCLFGLIPQLKTVVRTQLREFIEKRRKARDAGDADDEDDD